MNNSTKILTGYYSKRASEYETIYHRKEPKRQEEQRFLGKYIKEHFKNRYVLELACGTGYWTQHLLKTAAKIVAIDTSYEMLKIAGRRYSSHPTINFFLWDAYNPPKSIPAFTGMLAVSWFSHIPKRRIKTFLSILHSRLAPNSFVLFVDNVYHEDLGGKLIVKEGKRDTWKKRRLESGEEYEILKNYYTEEELFKIFSPYSKRMEIKYLTYFWLVGYVL